MSALSASEELRSSPQLIAFLRYVVEATLRGEQHRIKGYTIAVEALGRGDNFDPQNDPIIRVEATRLRRAIHRYYENGGRSDAVQIDLPLGSYVPVFRRGALCVAPVARIAVPRARRASWRQVALVLFGAGIYAALDFAFDFNTPNPRPGSAFLATQSRAAAAWQGHSIYPVIFVGAFAAAANAKPEAEMLRAKLRDALARFDAIQVVVEEPPSREHYQLTASTEYDAAGLTVLTMRLIDGADGSVAFSKTFSRDGRDGREEDSVRDTDAVVREVAATLAQPYGIIQSHERNKDPTGESGETQYRCLLEASDYWRSYDPQQHARARDCLERTTRASPGFALGHAALARILIEEARGVNARSGNPLPLQDALVAARRAVELKPGSARAHQALAEVQFARGDYPLAVEEGERAVRLNPYDPSVVADYGGMLVALGEDTRGARLVREAASALTVRPVSQDFMLFLAAYLDGDRAGTARYASSMTTDAFPLALVGHAIAAAQRGEPEEARRLLDRLAATRPEWRMSCRAELAKYLPAETIVARIEHDIARIDAVPGQ